MQEERLDIKIKIRNLKTDLKNMKYQRLKKEKEINDGQRSPPDSGFGLMDQIGKGEQVDLANKGSFKGSFSSSGRKEGQHVEPKSKVELDGLENLKKL